MLYLSFVLDEEERQANPKGMPVLRDTRDEGVQARAGGPAGTVI